MRKLVEMFYFIYVNNYKSIDYSQTTAARAKCIINLQQPRPTGTGPGKTFPNGRILRLPARIPISYPASTGPD